MKHLSRVQIIALFIAGLLIVSLVYNFVYRSSNTTNQKTVATITPTPTPSTPLASVPGVSMGENQLYYFENDYIKVLLPGNFTVGVAPLEFNQKIFPTGIFMLARNDFRLTVTTYLDQLPGISTSELQNIIENATKYPLPFNPLLCNDKTFLEKSMIPINERITRNDLYFNPSTASNIAKSSCGMPQNLSKKWYGSFITGTNDTNYFLEYKNRKDASQTDNRYVLITISFDTTDSNAYPTIENNSDILKNFDSILQSIEFK